MKQPKVKKIPFIIKKHNDIRVDNYYWLRDDERKSYEVINYLIEENKFSEKMLEPSSFLKKKIYNEFMLYTNYDDESISYNLNGYSYRTRFKKNKNYFIYERCLRNNNIWTVLIDGNERAKGFKYYHIGMIAVSPDNSIVAITEDKCGRNMYTVSFLTINNLEWKNDVLINTSSDIVWTNDSKILIYLNKNNTTLLPYQVFAYKYFEDKEQINLLYEEKNNTYCINLEKSTSKNYIFICIRNSDTSEYRLINSNNIKNDIIIFKPRQIGIEYYIDHFKNKFYIRSNHQDQSFGLYVVDDYNITNNDFLIWKILISPCINIILENFKLFTEWLVLEKKINGLINIFYINNQTKKENYISFDDPTYIAWIYDNNEKNTDKLRYVYSSLVTPYSIYEINMYTGEKKLLKQEKIKGFDKTKYKSERLLVTVSDNVNVPISLVYRKDMFEYFKNPLLIYAYGAYGCSIDLSFDFTKLSLLDRGFVYAIAHVRGGGDLGKTWYLQGKLLKKMNTFTDFIDVTNYLIKLGYGKKNHIYAIGASAGGLLIGAVINIAPELYKGVVVEVPFVDVLTTMLDSSIPLTTLEYDEWGDPRNKDFYNYIKLYSPYDNVKPQCYPNMLVTTGLYDSQVQYWEPAKWVAKLRDIKHKNSSSLLLFKINMNAGHNGNSGRLNSLGDIALSYSFLLMLENKKK